MGTDSQTNRIMDNLLSVVILSYKNGEMLYETLDSILEQTYPNIEIVVCDDASPVFEKVRVEKYIADHNRGNISHFAVIVNPANLGTVKNLNVGIAHAKGSFLKFIAGDDLLASPDICTIQVKYLEEHPEACLVFGNILECDDRMTPLFMSGLLLENDRDPLLRDRNAMLRLLVRKEQKALATQAICFRKGFFEKHGLYDERFKLIEDLPMAVRILESGEIIGYVNRPCVKHRGSVGVSTSSKAFDARRIRYYEDLEKYYALSLMPLKHIVGSSFVRMRHGVCKFRIEYCKLDPPTAANKMKTVIRHLPHLMYYALTRMNRMLFYLRG